MKKYITQNTLKSRNISDIFTYILERGSATRRDIEKDTGFSWGTVSAYVARLIEKGYIKESKISDGAVGRGSSALIPDGDKWVTVGLDINRIGLIAEVRGIDFGLRHTLTRPFAAASAAELKTAVTEMVDEAVKRAEKTSKVFALGAAVQGSVDPDAGIMKHFPGIADWQPYDIKSALEKRYGIPTFISHDPQCMLLAKARRDGIDGMADCALIRVDEGVGLAVMNGGALLDGSMKLELGHITSVMGGDPCTCGRKGCLEAYSTIRGIASRARVPFEEAAADPDKYGKLFDEAAECLGHAMYDVYELFSPTKIVLTGKLVAHGDIFAKANKVFGSLAGEDCSAELDPGISAAFGAAINAAFGAAALSI